MAAMTVFDAALGTLLTDPNLAVAADWQAAAGGAWIALRLAPAAPQDLIPLDGPGARAVAIEATLRAADLAQHPRRGDLLRWGSPLVTYRVETARPDPLGLSWTLGLVRTS